MAEDDPIPQHDPFDGTSPGAEQRFVLPRKPKTSPMGATVGVLGILLMVASGIWIIQRLNHRQITQQTETASPAVRPSTAQPPPAQTAEKHAVLPTSDQVAVDTGSSTSLPDERWDAVQEIYRTSSPALAIVALQDYLTGEPHSRFAPVANQQIEESLDHLWWLRVKDLSEQRDRLNNLLADIEKQLAIARANNPDPERIAELNNARAPLARELQNVRDNLSEMKFTQDRSPDPYDARQLIELRKQRDLAAYDHWKKMVLGAIRRNRGRLPW